MMATGASEGGDFIALRHIGEGGSFGHFSFMEASTV
jgi:hypothetical protein